MQSATVIQIGDWTLKPATGELSRDDTLIRLEDRPLRLLLCLAAQAGEVLSIDTLMSQVWQGVIVTPDSVYQAITALRRQLGDDPKHPSYIATVPRRGYRLIASVSQVASSAVSSVDTSPQPEYVQTSPQRPFGRPSRRLALALLFVLLASGLAVPFLARHAAAGTTPAPPTVQTPARSIAVLPFLDLTDQMSEEPFADGMAEELIDKLSKVPGLAVSPPASSNYFKERRVTVADVSRALHVAYVLDGSVRKSGDTVRVAARLTRASDGFVVWSETYDRSWHDKLMIQDDIAGEVSKALVKSIRENDA
ncbi:MAG: winged helix-turn-helix domain-containing protein [Burkholderiales bacterium]|nr:winged helix-turn-helix domain-containing protein [Burkholderiales bacterium]